MKIDVLTLFPKMFESVLGESIIKRARIKGLVEIEAHDLREWTDDFHRTADDRPFGGGPGMVMKVEPVYRGLEYLKKVRRFKGAQNSVILLTPQGRKFDQAYARRLAGKKKLILICGHYEGVDERIRELADEEISVGDYILTCGEIPAMVLIDSIVRLTPGVLGDSNSSVNESFENGLLEYPQYTRPSEFKGMKVPRVLLSGDHKKINNWRLKEAHMRTAKRRPDLLGESR